MSDTLEDIPVHRINVVEIRPADTIIIEMEGRLSKDGRDNLEKALRAVWPSIKVLVMDGGMRLTVAREV